MALVALGNRVWYDTDDSGQVDAGEVGIDGVAVELYEDTNGDGSYTAGVDELVSTTVTADGGYYTFTRLLPARGYVVVITGSNFTAGGVLEGYANSTATYGGNSDVNDVDHGAVNGDLGAGGYVASSVVTLTVGGEPTGDGDGDANTNLTIDFGFYRLSVGNRVWYDVNDNGEEDAGEGGAGGLTVRLVDGSGAVIATTTTDAQGYYTFTGLVSGEGYAVEVEVPAAYTSSTDLASSGDPGNNIDGDDNGVRWAGTAIRSAVFTPTAGSGGAQGNNTVEGSQGWTHDPTVDFGLVGRVALGNHLWYDTGAGGGTPDNGILDGAEPPVVGVEVQLYRAGDTPGVDAPLMTTTTDANGDYWFDALSPGSYFVHIPAVEFTAGHPLYRYLSSSGAGSDEVTDQNGDENGIDDAHPELHGISTQVYDLWAGTEATGELQSGYTGVLADASVNGTADLAFVPLVHTLSITKTATPSPVVAGTLLTYTITYAVDGNEAAVDATISDTVPAGTTYVSCAGGQSCSLNGATVFWSLGTLQPPSSGTVTLTVRVNADVAEGTVITNGVVITDSSGISDTDEITTPVRATADLVIVKRDDPDPVVAGAYLTYTLLITNEGPSAAVNVRVTDTLPAEVSFVSATPAQSSGPNPLVWQLGTLAAGASRQITVVVQVGSDVTATFVNTAQVGSDTGDSDTTNNGDDEPTTPLVPALVMAKSVTPGDVVRGMPFTYTIVITNTGPVPFTAVRLEDHLPPNFNYLVGSGTPADPDTIAEPTLIWNDLGPLAPDENLTVTFAVTAATGITGTYVNVATATGTTESGTSVTDTDDAVIALHDPAVVVDKALVSVDTDPLAPNYVTFTIIITNVGFSEIDILPLADQYDPADLSFVAATPAPDEPQDDGYLTWYDLTAAPPHGFDRDLRPHESFVITTVFRVVRDIVSTTNRAIVADALDAYDNDVNESDDAEVITGIPTAVELLYFRADAQGESIHLSWATAVEIDTFGFRLWRAETNDRNQATQIAFVAAQGYGGQGATYGYDDAEVQPNRPYWYWLEEVATDGSSRFHGPASAQTGTAARWTLFLPLVIK